MYDFDISSDYFYCETCLWDGVCDELTVDIPGTRRRKKARIELGGCKHYTPAEDSDTVGAVEYYKRDLDERAAVYRRLIDEFQ